MPSGRRRAHRLTGAQPDARAPKSFGPGPTRSFGYRKRWRTALSGAERTLRRHPSVKSATYRNGVLSVRLRDGEKVIGVPSVRLPDGEKVIVRSIEDLNQLRRYLATLLD